ncbi:MAG: methionyl-tRNA formyltransferase [Candidatus Zambryskibacteria bacterium CG10_big_fil_rev_8_21_14_0_10_42_12]|uniref:methionyl-tRNA formyltransferase n=1 Tax=Candidatus Zambryskibacteria bacterium CG10_big_fil_rev_8_21_14_0_10_42_12 TaxID=1975115 RepID=A0A2H0QWD2_9BACT|nr:MAG: methionyl-tRNA formyltransferase [Candidatus Zambryskibacteria bacterium CG10_big_fil_rev_8_21_14_0_10_42_12]
MSKNPQDISFAFFGGEPLAIPSLEALKTKGLLPKLVVTNPDRPSGRSQELTPPPTKVWATEHNIPVIQPESFKNKVELAALLEREWDVFLVTAFSAILPKWLIELPKHGTLNLHPSLLPKLRGASPIRSAILEDMRETGITIMHMDEKMDHGPIVAQETIEIPETNWPMRATELNTLLAEKGGNLLAETVIDWVNGVIQEHEQDHAAATFSKKFTKEDGEINLSDDAYKNLLKIRALEGSPGTYFFTDTPKGTLRVKIVDAKLSPDGSLNILRVIPEGKKEMSFEEFTKNISR